MLIRLIRPRFALTPFAMCARRSHLGTGLLLLAVLAGCAQQTAQGAPQASPSPLPSGQVALSAQAQKEIGLRVQRVEARAITSTLSATGKMALVPALEAHVTVTVTGRILKIYKRLGDSPSQGCPLALLDSPDLGQGQSDFLQAEAQRRLKKEALERQEGLFKRQFAAKKDLVQAQSDEIAAEIEFERATNKLLLLGMQQTEINHLAKVRKLDATMTIYAPIRGTITATPLTLGETIQAGSSIFTIDDMSRLWALADIHEQDLADVKPGAAVKLTAIAYPGKTFTGRVESLQESLTTDTHMAEARILVPNTAGLLKPQMYINADIASDETRKLTAVPATAVILDGKQRILYVQQAPGRFIRREIEVGTEANGFIAVKAGVKLGENVVSKGALLVDAEGKGG